MAVTIRGSGQLIVQMAQVVKTDVFSTSSTSLVDVTGLSVSITPTSSSNKILVIANITGGGSNLQFSQLVRDSTAIYKGDNASNRVGTTTGVLGDGGERSQSATSFFLDSPATTSAVTYKVQIRTQTGTAYLGRSNTDTDSAVAGQRTPCSLTVMEVAYA
jgi:hypothetical protein